MDKVARVKVEKDLKDSILKAVSLIGGFDQYIKTGDVVMLKPNFNTADPFPASTDLTFLRTVIELAYEYGAKLVMLGDSSTITMNTRAVMEKLNVFSLLKMPTPPRIYVFEEGEWVMKTISDGQFLKSASVPKILERPDKLIFLPCIKTHSYAQFTGSLKLAVGFMKPSERISLHLKHLQEKIAELNQIVHPDLIIADARKCFINQGPAHGDVREPGLILASTNRVALDVEGIKIIQSFAGNSLKCPHPWKLPQIKRAVELGIDQIEAPQ